MKRPLRNTVLPTLCLCLALAVPSAHAESECQLDNDDVVANEIILELAPGVDVQTIAARYGLTLIDGIAQWNLYLLRVTDGQDVSVLADLIQNDQDVENADEHLALDTPEGDQRSLPVLDNTLTAVSFREQPAAQVVKTALAHSLYDGTNVTVAILDTSMSLDHPETALLLIDSGSDFAAGNGSAGLQANGMDDDGDGNVDEALNHGSHVAGLLRLAAPGARILAIRVLEEDGKGDAFSVAKGILQALSRNADVINLSLSMDFESRVIEKAVEQAEEAGVVVVAAAGNSGLNCVEFPASMEETIAVAAVSPSLVRSDFSSYGPEIDIGAPGEQLISTHNSGDFATWDGTSFAAPFVSGAAAIILGKYPGLTPEEVRNVIRSTAAPDGTGQPPTGQMGAGVLDLAAVAAAETGDRKTLTLRIDDPSGGTVASWSPVLGATNYGLVRGDLEQLADIETAVSLGSLACIASGQSATDSFAFPDFATPPPGAGFFYLFVDDGPGNGGSIYGESSGDGPRISEATVCEPAP